MSDQIKKIIIVGGGTAGWLTAAIIAAEHQTQSHTDLSITLIESADVATIGVGEGSWPSLRETLNKIGINELEFLTKCHASFKQGSKFINWQTESQNDHYYHPFMTPQGYESSDLHHYWQTQNNDSSFADSVSIQGRLCDHHLAPKQFSTPDYAAVANYGYHFDSASLALLLKQHCITKLGVHHIQDHIEHIIENNSGDIDHLVAKKTGVYYADLFIDCSGANALLLSEHYKIPNINQKHILFNDSALAIQVPNIENQGNINSATLSTAQSAGWVWDIGLQNRRGIGYTYSSAHITDEDAEIELLAYLKNNNLIGDTEQVTPKKLKFEPAYREKFWHKNCVAIGMSAGFIEPLEASAIAMVELGATYIAENLPKNRRHMSLIENSYNQLFRYRWERVIDFVKLHYVVSKRNQSSYWQDNRNNETIPDRLKLLLELWRYQPPQRHDLLQHEEIFPSASYQFILYGTNFKTQITEYETNFNQHDKGSYFFNKTKELADQCMSSLPTNRKLLNQLIVKYREHS